MVKQTAIAIKEIHGVSPSGKLKATLDVGTSRHTGPNSDRTTGEGWKVKVSRVELEHADVDFPELIFELNTDASGHITSMRMIKTSLEQSFDVDDFLEHYGKKGMKWGVRKTLLLKVLLVSLRKE